MRLRTIANITTIFNKTNNMGKKEEKFNDYDGFVEKFKPKKTTDE